MWERCDQRWWRTFAYTWSRWDHGLGGPLGSADASSHSPDAWCSPQHEERAWAAHPPHRPIRSGTSRWSSRPSEALEQWAINGHHLAILEPVPKRLGQLLGHRVVDRARLVEAQAQPLGDLPDAKAFGPQLCNFPTGRFQPFDSQP